MPKNATISSGLDDGEMKCPQCESTSYRKNGHRSGRQNYLCKNCGRQFVALSSTETLPTNASAPVPAAHNGNPEVSVEMDKLLFSGEMLSAKTQTEPHLDSRITTQELLESLLSPELLESPSFKKFVQKFHELKEPSAESESAGISILLLDVENLKLDVQIEKFLTDVCVYPLQVKIAFANWRNPTIGKQDTELYQRGYQLIHVPSGPSSADGKMLALGSSIFLHYPNVKEVFVCSCDGILTHLCNELQNKGLTVYWVRRQQDHILQVENRNNGKVNHYSLAVGAEIPSLESFVHQLEEFIKAEHKSITERVDQLSTVATLFQERRNLTLNGNRSNWLPIIAQEPDEITPVQEQELTQSITQQKDALITTSAPLNINSKNKFVQALIISFESIKIKSPATNISIGHLGTEFRAVYHKSASSVIKKLELGSNLSDFLQSCSAFTIQNGGNGDQVELAKPALSDINSPAALQQALISVMNSLIIASTAKPITIVTLAGEFNKQYEITISAIIKQLQLKGNFTQFLKSCPVFHLEPLGTTYTVAIANS